MTWLQMSSVIVAEEWPGASLIFYIGTFLDVSTLPNVCLDI